MNRETGEVHLMHPHETLAQLSDRLKVHESKLQELKHGPDQKCSRCGGRGSIRKGLFSKRYEPCPCTQT